MSTANDYDQLGAAVAAEIEAAIRGKVLAQLSYLQQETVTRGPKLSGWFRGSVFPWNGAPGDFLPEEGLPFYPEQGDFEVDAVMEQFELGTDVGIASNAPHANRLAHGWSAQAADGWTDVVAMEAAAL